MFLTLGNSRINLQYVVQIKERSVAPGQDNVSVVLHDGTTCSGFMTESALAALEEHIVAAQPGYEAYREYDSSFGDDEIPATLEWKPVVAFVYHPDYGILQPITAEDGRLERFAVRLPNGKVYTSHETFFDSANEYRADLVKERAKGHRAA